jgi:hypothetical protein
LNENESGEQKDPEHDGKHILRRSKSQKVFDYKFLIQQIVLQNGNLERSGYETVTLRAQCIRNGDGSQFARILHCEIRL